MLKKRLYQVIACTFIAAGIQPVFSASTLYLNAGQYNTRIFRSPSGIAADSLRYIIRPPANYDPSKKEAIIISMHGVGPPQNPVSPAFPGEGYGPVLWYDDAAKYRSFILEPFCPLDQTCWDNTGWATGNHVMSAEPTHGIRMVFELITFLQKDLNLDSSRVRLIGASNGGYAQWDMILRKPEMFAGAVPICGAGDSSKAGRILSFPLRVYHGSGDLSNPVSGSHAMVKALRLRGGNPYYYEVPLGIMPASWGYNATQHAAAWWWSWNDAALLPWLFKQTKIPDTTAPSVPTGLVCVAQSGGGKVNLSWNASTDVESKTASYFIYRDGARIGTARTTSFVDSFRTELKSYQYQVSAFNPCDKESNKCVAVQIQTLADTKSPEVLFIRVESTTLIKVRFSEKISATSAIAAVNYIIPSVTVSAVVLLNDSSTVRLTVNGLLHGQNYLLTVNNISDRATQPNILSTSGALPFVCRASGFILQETWTGMPGYKIADLIDSAKYQNPPSRIDTLRSVQTRSMYLANYGSRVRGYFFPGVTGDYRFWINSDDASRLLISTDSNPVNKVLKAEVVGYLPQREYDFTNIQASDTLRLIKDKKYYFEILYKQKDGGDFCSVAWQRIGGAAREIIPAEYILPYPEGVTPTQTIVQPVSLLLRPAMSVMMSSKPSIRMNAIGDYHIEIFNARGALVQSMRGNQPQTFAISPNGSTFRTLVPGLYTIKASLAGTVKTLGVILGVL